MSDCAKCKLITRREMEMVVEGFLRSRGFLVEPEPERKEIEVGDFVRVTYPNERFGAGQPEFWVGLAK